VRDGGVEGENLRLAAPSADLPAVAGEALSLETREELEAFPGRRDGRT
jgi:hypothetical protein